VRAPIRATGLASQQFTRLGEPSTVEAALVLEPDGADAADVRRLFGC
jgi:hypothetical protein